MEDSITYFPIKVQFNDGSIVILNSPEEIPSGKGFKVLETNSKRS